MRRVISFLLISFVLVAFVGVSFAKTMSGEVTNVNTDNGTITIKGKTMDVQFDCDNPLLKDVNVGDRVTVKYNEKNGKKTVTALKQIPKKKVGDGK